MGWDRDAAGDRRPGPAIADARVERVIDAVLGRLDAAPAPPAWQDWLRAVLATLAPATRFAMPMAAAALLGIMVGQHLEAAETAAQVADLLTATTFYGTGY